MRYPVSSVLLAALLALVVVAGSGGVVALAGTGGAVDGGAVDGTMVDGVAVDDASVDPTGIEPTATTEIRPTLVGQFDPDPRTEITVHPDPDGDADWVVSVQYRFTDANETAVFEEVGDRFRAGEIGPSAALFENFAASASRNVDREMTIEDPDRNVLVHDDPEELDVEDDDVVAVGELRLTFTWTAFLEEDGENLVLGDALTTANDGTWVRSLEDGQSIEVQTPEGYTIAGTPGASFDDVSDNSVIIEGPRTFEDDDRVIAIYSPSPGPDAPPWTLLAGAIVVAALLIAAGLLGYRRFGDGGSDGDGSAGATGPDSGSAGATGVGGAGAGDTAGGSPAGAVTADDTGESEEDLSLLSDEERVERLLEIEGGRMRQADIVKETGWSDAKVSQLLSAMADEGRIEKLRLGRENLISLPDDEDADGSDGSGGSGGSADAE